MVSRASLEHLTRDELIAQLEAELAGIGRMKQARCLAPEVMNQFGISPNGIDQVLWLGDARCRSNTEAVIDWIERQLEDPVFVAGVGRTTELDLLIQRLRIRLAMAEGSFAC